MRGVMTALAVLVICPVAIGQNLLSNPSFQDPAYARIQIKGPVADGDLVTLDVGGAHQRIYEYDTGNGIAPTSDVPVDVSGGTDADTAALQLAAAINGDASAPATATTADIDGPGGEDPDVLLTWKGVGGDGALNSSTNANFEVDDFNEKCRQNYATIIGWQGANHRRNGDVFLPQQCLDGEHASLQGSGSGVQSIYQTVTVSPATTYLLTGVWTVGRLTGTLTCTAALYNGTDLQAPPIASTSAAIANMAKANWLPFAVTGTPSGTEMTVVLTASYSGSSLYALHLNDISLVQTTCTPPTITSFAPSTLFRGTQYTDVAIAGSGFVADQTTVRLEGNDVADIVASVVTVNSSSSLTCTLTIGASESVGFRAAVVEVAGCGGNALGDATEIAKSGPFENGSFELADPFYNQCPVHPQPAPSDWDAVEINGYGGQTKLARDDFPAALGGEPAPYLPSCDKPGGQWPHDGWHYAATISQANNNASPQDYIFQTFRAYNPASPPDPLPQYYTFTGYFAGGGPNRVRLEMRDGTSTGTLLGWRDIHSGGGSYDWTFGAVKGGELPSNPNKLLTVGWRVSVLGDPPHASYADDTKVEACFNPITVTSVSPGSGINSGTVHIDNLAGTGFVEGGNQQVLLTKPGVVVNATIGTVDVISPTEIECDFDLTGLPSGKYDILVVQNGCVGALAEQSLSFQVIATTFVNGSFEDPSAPENCGGNTYGTPTGWNTADELDRDRDVHNPCAQPIPDGIHYGSMTTGEGEIERAWQTLKVNRRCRYRFAGQFAGGGTNTVRIRLLDGAETGTEIASTTVYQCGSGCSGYPWTAAEVEGVALSDTLTVMWEMIGALDASATHADALLFEEVSCCNDPFADVDDDDDVDQEDFAVLQLCITGPGGGVPLEPAYCSCLERTGDDAIDQTDVAEFEACASGPGVTADADCDND